MRRLLPIIAVVAAGAPSVAQACSCAPESIHSLFATLGFVFEGTVDGRAFPLPSNASGQRQHAVVFKVGRVWKGDVGPAFNVVYPVPSGANCGAAPKEGETLLIGAYVEAGRPSANSCTLMNMNQPTLDHVRSLGTPLRDHRR
jgi:hypothetical protein